LYWQHTSKPEDGKGITAVLATNRFFIGRYRTSNRSNPNQVKYSTCKNYEEETMQTFSSCGSYSFWNKAD